MLIQSSVIIVYMSAGGTPVSNLVLDKIYKTLERYSRHVNAQGLTVSRSWFSHSSSLCICLLETHRSQTSSQIRHKTLGRYSRQVKAQALFLGVGSVIRYYRHHCVYLCLLETQRSQTSFQIRHKTHCNLLFYAHSASTVISGRDIRYI